MALKNDAPLSSLRARISTSMLAVTLFAFAVAAPSVGATEETAGTEETAAAEETQSTDGASTQDTQDLSWLADDSCLSLVSLATVSTDQDDYAPGSTVDVTGSGFGANCAYELQVIRPDGVVETFDVLSGQEGELAHSFILPPPPGVIGDYRIDIVGPANEVVATWWFTDNIAFANHASNNTGPGGAGTLTIGKPTSTATGDFLIAQVSVGGINASEPICAPSGWTSIGRDTRGSDVSMNTFWKVASSADASVTNYQFFARNSTCTSGSNLSRRMSGGILRYTGVHPTTPLEASLGTSGAVSTTLTAPSVTASAGSRVIGFYAIKKNTLITPHPADGMAVPPDGPTSPRYSVFVNDGSGPGSMSADLVQGTTGPTGAKRATVPSANAETWVARLVSLKAAPTPTKLGFTTPARTGAVGQCLGPITVQTQDATNAAVNVSSATQVNLASDGSGAFHTDGGCATASVSTVTIANGGNATTFYYKAAAFGTGSHQLTASATGLTSANQTQTITNPAPVLTAPDDQTAVEGSASTFDLGSFTDADDPGPWTVDVDWGDGSDADSFQVNDDGDIQRAHTYADNGSYTVEVTVTDASDQTDSETFEVTVDNVAPTLTAAGDQDADEGASAAFELGSFSDPGLEDSPWTVTLDWGDGSDPESFDVTEQGDIGGSHTYDDNETFTVSVTVTDKDGDSSTEESFEVTVANVAPSAAFANDGPVDEGSSFTVSLSNPSDPSGADTTAGFEYAFDCGDGDGYDAFAGDASRSCPTSDDGSRSVGGKIRDKDGGVEEYTATVTVDNVAPTLTGADDQEANEGESMAFELGSFSDPGADSPWSVTVDWGDGSDLETFDANATGDIGRSHTYADNGLYTVTVTVTDKDGADSGEASFDVTVHNANPVLTGADDQQADEGAATEFALGSFEDPGTEDSPWTVTVEWGDGSDLESFDVNEQGEIGRSHTYDDSATFTVSVSVTDKDDGASSTESFEVTVANVAPSATFANDGPVNEGSSFELSLSDPSDPSGADTTAGFEYAFDCGDGGGFGVFGAAASRSCPTSDDGSRDVGGKIRDKDGGVRTYTDTVTVDNVAPAVTAPDDQQADEGASTEFELGSFTDPGADGPWQARVDWGDGSPATTFTEDAGGPITAKSHTYADDGTYEVSLTVAEAGDGETPSDTKTFEIEVANVAPAVTAPDDQTANEGAGTEFDLGSFTDPGADGPWGVTVAWGDGSPATTFTEAVPGAITGKSHAYDDDGSYTVTVTVAEAGDGETPSGSKTFEVTVANVAPSATFGNDGPVNEGSSFELSLSDPSDPSAADTTAGFEYAFDCGDGDGYGDFGAPTSRSCATSDDGSRSVGGKIRDKDGGVEEYTATVTVDNVAPALTGADAQESDEGESNSFDLGSFSDPGADSPWAVTVDWDDGSAAETFDATDTGAIGRSHTYADNGTYSVGVTVTDKDDGASSTETFAVTVHNVAPTITQFTGTHYFHGPLAFTGGGSANSLFTTVFSDPGTVDTHSAYFEYSDGSPLTETVSPFESGQVVKHRFASAGCDKSAAVKVTDKDGDYDTAETTVDVGSGTFLPPMTNQPVTDKLKNGQVLPVKIRVAGCDGLGLTTLSPTIKLVVGDQTAVAESSSTLIDPTSVSAADTTGVMRHSGGGDYIYNMKVQLPLNTKYTVVIYPFGGTSGPRLAHLIEATK